MTTRQHRYWSDTGQPYYRTTTNKKHTPQDVWNWQSLPDAAARYGMPQSQFKENYDQGGYGLRSVQPGHGWGDVMDPRYGPYEGIPMSDAGGGTQMADSSTRRYWAPTGKMQPIHSIDPFRRSRSEYGWEEPWQADYYAGQGYTDRYDTGARGYGPANEIYHNTDSDEMVPIPMSLNGSGPTDTMLGGSRRDRIDAPDWASSIPSWIRSLPGAGYMEKTMETAMPTVDSVPMALRGISLSPPQSDISVFSGSGSDDYLEGRAGRDRMARSSGPSQEDIHAIIDTAGRLGISPENLAKVVAYETDGTFSPTVTNGKNYIGAIQFSPGIQQNGGYGYRPGMTLAEQIRGPAYRYLVENGVRPGMGLAQVYSVVNTGGLYPGGQPRWNWPDANGTLASKMPVIEQRFGQMARDMVASVAPSAISSGLSDAISAGPDARYLDDAGAFAARTAPTSAPPAVAGAPSRGIAALGGGPDSGGVHGAPYDETYQRTVDKARALSQTPPRLNLTFPGGKGGLDQPSYDEAYTSVPPSTLPVGAVYGAGLDSGGLYGSRGFMEFNQKYKPAGRVDDWTSVPGKAVPPSETTMYPAAYGRSQPLPQQRDLVPGRGMHGRDVSDIQRQLASAGYLDPQHITGRYDETPTLAAIHNYQRDHPWTGASVSKFKGVPPVSSPDLIVGPRTRKSLQVVEGPQLPDISPPPQVMQSSPGYPHMSQMYPRAGDMTQYPSQVEFQGPPRGWDISQLYPWAGDMSQYPSQSFEDQVAGQVGGVNRDMGNFLTGIRNWVTPSATASPEPTTRGDRTNNPVSDALAGIGNSGSIFSGGFDSSSGSGPGSGETSDNWSTKDTGFGSNLGGAYGPDTVYQDYNNPWGNDYSNLGGVP